VLFYRCVKLNYSDSRETASVEFRFSLGACSVASQPVARARCSSASSFRKRPAGEFTDLFTSQSREKSDKSPTIV